MKKLLIATQALLIFSVGIIKGQESFRPEIYGLVKARYETAVNSGDMRFSVRNTRLGVRGNVTSAMRYAMQMELNSLGNFSVLDAYAAFRAGDFELSLGQQQYKFSTEMNRGAGGYFANRSFMAKFISRYYEEGAEPAVYDIGARDLGAMLKYEGNWGLPVAFYLGTFNGSGVNNPQWDDHLNMVGRIDVGGTKGFGASGTFYTGRSPLHDKFKMWGVEAKYTGDKLLVESEFAMRYLEKGTVTDVTAIALVHAMYSFPLPQNNYARHITPQLRWDYGDNIKFINTVTHGLDRFDGHRITVGLTIGLTEKLLESEVRFNYEHYLMTARPTDFGINQLFQDKFSIEFFAKF